MAVPGSLEDLDQVAQHLFASLRELDAHEVEVILARAFPQHGIGNAQFYMIVSCVLPKARSFRSEN